MMALRISQPTHKNGLFHLKYLINTRSLSDCNRKFFPVCLRLDAPQVLSVNMLYQLNSYHLSKGVLRRNIQSCSVLMSRQRNPQDKEKRNNFIFIGVIVAACVITGILSLMTESHQDYVIVDKK